MSKKIYLSPSDQRSNTYAVGNTNEAVQCRRIATAAVTALERCGFEARTNTTWNGDDAMEKRVSESNAWGADLHVPIHTNAFNGKVTGTRMFAYDTKGEGYKACKAIMAALSPITPGESDNITEHHWYEVDAASAPTAYLEVGFHDSKEEAQWIIDHTVDIAEAICKGVCNYFGVKYVAPATSQSTKPSDSTSGGKLYRVQVGAFTVKANAEALLKKLKAAGFADAYIREG